MIRDTSDKIKQAPDRQRPFPWRCRECGAQQVESATMTYEAAVRHDGRLYHFTIPRLTLPVCNACGAKLFTTEVDSQINHALRAHLNLLTPGQIRTAIARIGLSQKETAKRLGIAEETLSRWLNETQIQSRAMDQLLRGFFAFPELRAAFSGESQDPTLGLNDIVRH